MTYANQTESTRKKGLNGCLIGCLGMLVLLGGGVTALLFSVSSFLRSNGAAQGAMERLQANSQAIDALGEPIKMGRFVSGSISVDGPSGEADLSIPVSGPREDGTLYVEAEKQAGEWEYQLLELAIGDGGDRIDLLPRFSVNPHWQLPEPQLFQPVFVVDTVSDVEIQFLPSMSF